MNNVRKGLAILGLASTLAFVGPAFAQDTGFYAGLSFGQTSTDIDCSGLPVCDDSDKAWKILGGYRFNRNFAAELGYTDLGEASIGDGVNNFSAEFTAFEVVAVGSWPVTNEFSVYGKIGLFRWDSDGTGTGLLAGFSGSDSGTDVTFGVGVQYDFTKQFGVRGEWQSYSADDNIDVFSIGVIFRF